MEKRKVYTRCEGNGTPGGWSEQWALVYPIFDEVFEIVSDENDAEFSLVACINDYEAPKKPVVLVSLNDYCGLNAHYKWWLNNHEPVAVILTHGIREEYRDRIGRENIFNHELPVRELHAKLKMLYHGGRIFIGPSFSCWPRLKPLYDCNLPCSTDRETDIYFAGTTEYKDPWHSPLGDAATAHRKAMLQACFRLPYQRKNISDHRVGGAMESWEQLKRTRITPLGWGWGAATHRDTEAILCGSRVVKPFCGWLETYPDIYSSDAGFFTWCDYSWLNLPEACEDALSRPVPDKAKLLHMISGWREHLKKQLLLASELVG